MKPVSGNRFLEWVIVLLLMSGSLLFFPFVSVAAAPGDANDDGKITQADVTAIVNHILGIESAPGNPDCNGDGVVNIQDVICVINIIKSLPPDPGDVAPPLDTTVATTIAKATEFIYTGTNSIQTGVTPGTIESHRVAVLRGKVMTREGGPLSGVKVTILNHPDYGQTLSRTDGVFDMVVNGGGLLIVRYEKEGYLVVQRQVDVPWQDYRWLPDVILIQPDPNVTGIDLSVPTVQVARGNVETDDSGSRQATVLFLPGTQAQMVFSDGNSEPISIFGVRATEYTVGPNGPMAMPAELPPTSFYTYAVDLSVREAELAGASTVTFSQPVYVYLENFVGFPVGIQVPSAYYDSSKGAWVPIPDGRVIKILGINNNLADLDTNGDGLADDPAALAALGITEDERQKLAELYQPGITLWRVAVNHFTPHDFNWSGIISDFSTYLNQLQTIDNEGHTIDDPCTGSGWGTIECQNQIFRESAGITGTSFSLHYASDRVPGRIASNTIRIPLSGNSIPDLLTGIELEVVVAGTKFTQSFPALPNQTYDFVWDDKDAYGRSLQGRHPVLIRIGYKSDPCYGLPVENVRITFAIASGQKVSLSISCAEARSKSTQWREQRTAINLMDSRGYGIGGWTVNVHHAYDPVDRVLYLGDGTRRSAEDIGTIITTVAGTGEELPNEQCPDPTNLSPCGDGGPANQAQLDWPVATAAGPDGSLYIAQRYPVGRIRKVGPDGIITTILQQVTWHDQRFSCDGIPALDSTTVPVDIALGPDGAVYFSNYVNSADCICRINQDGIINRVAGKCGFRGFGGDGGPATEAVLGGAWWFTVGPDGSVYMSDIENRRIRKVGPAGIINTIAGNGSSDFSGDGGPALQAAIGAPGGLTLGPDGSIYFIDLLHMCVRRVGPDGVIHTVICFNDQNVREPSSMALSPSGDLYIVDSDASGPNIDSVWRVTPDDFVIRVAGIATDESFGDGGPATQAGLRYPQDVTFGPDGSYYITEWRRIRRVGPAIAGFNAREFAITSSDGSQIYQFDEYGRHLRTINALTGGVLYHFGYDGSNRLITITDGDGNVTRIERDASGNPTAIVAPFGQRTVLSLNADRYLAALANPAGEVTQFAYGNQGLLTGVTGPLGFTYSMNYDLSGRLVTAQDPAGGSNSLSRTEAAKAFEVTTTTGMGRITKYSVETLPTGLRRMVNTFPDGTTAQSDVGTDGKTTTTLPDGTVTALIEGPDPRFGMQAPIAKSLTITTPGGLSSSTTMTRSVTLTDPDNPFSLSSMTETTTVNGRTFSTTFDASTRTFTLTSPVGRQTTSVINASERPVQLQVPGIEGIKLSYDVKGRLTDISRGTGDDQRSTTIGYNTAGYLETITDSLGRIESYTYNSAGRITQQTLPDGRMIQYSYDAQGNLTSITPPGRPQHTFNYTPVDLQSEYSPPDVGAGTNHTLYDYNVDRQLTRITRPDSNTIDLTYDSTGRLNVLSLPGNQLTYGYSPTTGRLSSINSTGAGTLSYNYDASLLTSETWTGTVAGSVSRTYDNDFRLASIMVNRGDTVTFQYDNDSLLTNAGDLILTRDPQSGLLTGTTLGNVTDARSYNSFAEPLTYTAAYNGGNIYSEQYTYDKLGRITQKTETVGGATDTYDYTYDLAGRLIEVKKDGSTISAYTYDSNGNRLTETTPGGTTTYTYDDQDRLTQSSVGSPPLSTVYTNTNNGELASKTEGGQITTYQYEALGNLLSVTLPGGTQIQYIVDGRNRRIGKKVNGTLVKGFLYGDQLSPVAELDGSNNLVSYFVYVSRPNVPHYMVKGGLTYRIISDHLGSPRLVVNTATGEVVQRMDYDEFGRVADDTNPGFQPFGFAGGIYDPDTGLVRFGARDYDAEAGRWTSKDPILFDGGAVNLYAYVGNDPINLADRIGLGPGKYVGVAATYGAVLMARVLATVFYEHNYLTTPPVEEYEHYFFYEVKGGSGDWAPPDLRKEWDIRPVYMSSWWEFAVRKYENWILGMGAPYEYTITRGKQPRFHQSGCAKG